MARNMIESNSSFFNNILSTLKSDDLIARVAPAKRYLRTDETEKDWLKNLVLKDRFHFSHDSFAILSVLHNSYYLCLVNVDTRDNGMEDPFNEIPVNSGLATVLGAEGYLTSNLNMKSCLEIVENVLYDILETRYSGHQWTDIEQYFPSIRCYDIKFSDRDVNVEQNINFFYWLLCRVALRFEICNNNYGKIALDAWEKVIYEYDFLEFDIKIC